MSDIRPITPLQATEDYEKDLPNEVVEAFNELIRERYDGSQAIIYQEEVINRMSAKGLSRAEVFTRGWLNVENMYRKVGWKVSYDKPGFNENYNAFFRFERNLS